MDSNQVRIAVAAPVTGQEIPAAGESEAVFVQVIARHHAQLYRVALRHLGNPDDAQDALQEGLLLAYRNRHQFQGRSELSTWLTRIVINAARGQRRRAASRPATSLEECTEAGREFADGRPDPEARCAQNERKERLSRLLKRLSPPLRYAIQLCEIEELPLRQAAERLGIKPATLKCRLFRGRARLAALAA
ncbi:MAG TPA: RNA polymerase sigma factor [Terriglobales bacterium]|nr:RNA polymerase sigma factor [Terriglobales bacterium]